jgi:uncharacterized protein (DUF2147 family)
MQAKLVVCVAALIAFAAPGHSQSPAQSPVGLWQAVDPDSKQPTGWFLISDHDGVYDGIIARMFLQPGQDPGKLCDQCKDDRHNHPWLGLQIIRGMQPDSYNKDSFTGGTILDPRNGKIYKAEMKLTNDGQTLVVRGYLGFALFGENQYWTRLPDSAYSMLDPSVNPNPAVNQKPSLPAHRSDGTAQPENSARR